MRLNYAQVRKDFEYLETLADLVDQVELDSEREQLMQNPTKRKAADMYHSAVLLWFGEHGTIWFGGPEVNQKTLAIANRYGATL